LHNKLDIKPEEIIMYLRKSRADDPLETVEETLANHEQILDGYCSRVLPYPIPEENRIKEVVSGESLSERSGFRQVLRMLESPQYKAVIVKEISRLGRPDKQEIGYISKIFRFTNTIVITPSRTFDIADEFERKMFEQELEQGNFYLEYSKKIMNVGRELSVSKGNYIGSIPPYGYDKIWVKEGKDEYPTLVENKEQADVVRMIFDMYVNQDIRPISICKHLDELHIRPRKGDYWSPHTIRDLLKNIHYIGKVKWNHTKTKTIVEDGDVKKIRPKAKAGEYAIYEGRHSAIVSEDIFNLAQEKIGKNHRAKSTTKVRNPLAGLLYCKCGRAMSMRTYKSKGEIVSRPRLLCDDQVHCGNGSCYYDEIIDFVADEILKTNIADFEMKMKNETEDSVKTHEKLIKNLEKKLSDLEAKELAQWEAQTDPNSDEKMPPEIFKQLNAKVLKEKEETRQALKNARESMPKPVNYSERIFKFQQALDMLKDDTVSAEKKNKHLKECIERIEYSREKPQRVRRKEYEKKGETLPTGATWTTPPINMDVTLKV
jgi:DNA invertase Pin-like site-specific DNA recombinase